MSGTGGGGTGTKMIYFLVFVFGLILFTDFGECIVVNLTDAQIQTVLDVHNQYRKQEGAADMNYMTWSVELAEKAQEYAEQCVFEHGMLKWDGSTYNSVGQNLYFATVDYAVSHAMMKWYTEKPNYDFATQTCASGKICGHYTQLVWGASKEIGCGWTYCSEIVTDSSTTPPKTVPHAYYFACNYGPQGNIVTLDPYIPGTACTKCGSGVFWCYKGLCRDDCSASTSGCTCNAACQNCGTVDPTACTCSCVAGKFGDYCQHNCTNLNTLCGTEWPKYTCNHATFGPQITKECPSMCGACEPWTEQNELLATECKTTTTVRAATTDFQTSNATTVEATTETTTVTTTTTTTQAPPARITVTQAPATTSEAPTTTQVVTTTEISTQLPVQCPVCEDKDPEFCAKYKQLCGLFNVHAPEKCKATCGTCQTQSTCVDSEEHETSPTSPPSNQRPPPSNQRPPPTNQRPPPNGRPPRPGRPRPQSPPNQRPRPSQQHRPRPRPRPRPGSDRRPWQREGESGFDLEQDQYNAEEIWDASEEENWNPWQQQSSSNSEENWNPWQQQNNNEDNLSIW